MESLDKFYSRRNYLKNKFPSLKTSEINPFIAQVLDEYADGLVGEETAIDMMLSWFDKNLNYATEFLMAERLKNKNNVI